MTKFFYFLNFALKNLVYTWCFLFFSVAYSRDNLVRVAATSATESAFTSTSEIHKKSDKVKLPHRNNRSSVATTRSVKAKPVVQNLATLGCITIVTTGGGLQNTDWEYIDGVITPMSATDVSIDASEILDKLNFGPLTVAGSCITVSSSLLSDTGNSITFKTADNIVVDNSVTISTSGGSVVFWANSNGNPTNAGVFLKSNSNIVTSGGHIWMGGGATSTTWNGLTVGNGFAMSGRDCNDMGLGNWTAGIVIDNSTINSQNGNIYIAGQRNEASTSNGAGFISIISTGSSWLLGTGTITIKGENTAGLQGYGIVSKPAGLGDVGELAISSFNANEPNAIVLEGSTTNGMGDGILIENKLNLTSEGITNGGGVSIIATGNIQNSMTIGRATPGELHIISKSGTINVNGGVTPLYVGTDSVFSTNLDFYNTFGPTFLTSGTSSVVITANEFTGLGKMYLGANGTATLSPYSSSFTSTLDTSRMYFYNHSVLTLGSTSNTSDIIVGSGSSISGCDSVYIYGTNIALNAFFYAVTVQLTATGAVTQALDFGAENLLLQGTATFNLNNSNNLVYTLAGGNTTTKLGSLSLATAYNDITIGTVGSTSGITATGPIVIETIGANINVAQNIATDATTDDAVVLNAGKDIPIDDATGGDIFILGTPTITAGSGGIIKLFSGNKNSDLTAFVGGDANIRLGVDETTTIFDPTLTNSSKFALYRQSQPVSLGGCITIVASGGGLLDTDWEYVNNTIKSKTTADVSINAADVLDKLSAGDLTVAGSCITINSTLDSDTSNSITFKASENIVVANSVTIKTIGGSVVLWANFSDLTTGAGIFLNQSNRIETSGGHIWMGGGNTSTLWKGLAVGNGYAVSGRDCSDMRLNTWKAGIAMDQAAINSGGGDIYIAGQRNETTGSGAGIVNYSGTGTTIEAGAGIITLKGKNTGAGLAYGIVTGVHSTEYTGTFNVISTKSLVTNGIEIEAVSTAGTGDGILIENTTNLKTYSGISINASGLGNAISIGKIGSEGTLAVLCDSGIVDVNVGTGKIFVASSSIFSSNVNYYDAQQSRYILFTNTRSSMKITANDVKVSGKLVLGDTEEVSITPPPGSSFDSTFNTNGMYFMDNAQLTIGRSTNTSDIIIDTRATVRGVMNIYGNNIEINKSIAVGGIINLVATGAVTQTNSIQANQLSLNGTATFDLNHSNNQIVTLAGGNATTKLGSLSFFNQNLTTIGTVGTTNGITATGPILIATGDGNLTVAKNIATDATTADAVVLNAGKNDLINFATKGDIIRSGTPTITAGTGGIVKLFSGNVNTDLITFVGGRSNARFGVDETTIFNPSLANNLKYALFRIVPPFNLADYGCITINANATIPGDAEGSTWVYVDNMIRAKSDTPAKIDELQVYEKLASGDLTIAGSCININTSLGYGATSNGITIKAAGDIVVKENSGFDIDGHIILWANSNNNSTNGGIFLKTGSELYSNQHIWLGGGAISTTWNGLTVGNGYAVSGRDCSDMGLDNWRAGIALDDEASLYAKGDIYIAGQRNESTNPGAGFISRTASNNVYIETDLGAITIKGENTATGQGYGIVSKKATAIDTGELKVLSYNYTAANAIVLDAKSTAGTGDGILIENKTNLTSALTTKGAGISIKASGLGNAISIGGATSGDLAIVSQFGNIDVNVGDDPLVVATGSVFTTNVDYFDSVDGGYVYYNDSKSNVSITANELNVDGNMYLGANGTVTLSPAGNSFTSTLDTSRIYFYDNSVLTLGSPTNTSDIIVGSSTRVNDSAYIYGNNIAINEYINANNTIHLTATGAVTQTNAAIQAENLLLQGTATFDLNNNNNQIYTLAGGNATTKLGRLSFITEFETTIGTVGTTNGIAATGTILIETGEGNLTVAKNIATNATSADAVVLNAGKFSDINTSSGGDIIFSGSPTFTTGTGGIIKLFSGGESPVLTDFVGGVANTRFGVDETTPTFDPLLSNSLKFALFRTPPPVDLATLGCVTIVNMDGDFEGSTWKYVDNTIMPTSAAPALVNSSVIVSKLGLGNLTVAGSCINIKDVVYSGVSNGVTFKAAGDIVLDELVLLRTIGGSVILWANSNNQFTNAGIFLKKSNYIETMGGHIWMGGGNTSTLWNGLVVGNGYAVSGRDCADMQLNEWKAGIAFNEANINSGGGNIYIAGQRNENSSFGAGFINYTGNGTTIDSGSGTVTVKGENKAEGISFGVMTGLHPSSYAGEFQVQSSNATEANAIVIEALSTATNSDGILIENKTELISSTSANGGGIAIIASGTRNAVSVGIGTNPGELTLSSESGTIDVNVGNNSFSIASAGIFRIGAPSYAVTSTANVKITSDNVNWLGQVPIRTNGTLTITPSSGSSFTSTFNTNGLTYNGVSGFIIGSPSNTSDIDISSTTVIDGPINIYGKNIAINRYVRATNSTLSLFATGTVTQTSAIVAANLILDGTGTFNLTNQSNDIKKIAGGNATTKLGSLSFTNESRDLSISTIGSTSGITSSGPILIEVGEGNLTIEQNIATNATNADAVVLNAGKDYLINDISGGDIIFSGSPTITTGTGGIIKLFSGDESSVLTNFVGGQANIRLGVDETTTSFIPAIANSLKFALYRKLQGPTAPLDIVLSSTTINENNAIGFTIGSISSIDANLAETHTYSLVSGPGSTDNASFTISADKLNCAIVFDYELKSSYSIRIQSTDSNGLTFEKIIVLTVNNLSETPNISITQNVISGVVNQPTPSITVTNTGGEATYTISPALPLGMVINSSTGLISGTPTVATASGLYTVTATNSFGSSTATFRLFIDGDLDGDSIGDATDPDIDGDAVSNVQEAIDGTNPLKSDSDGDGVLDSAEKSDGTDANDSCKLILASQTLAPSPTWSTADCDGDKVPNAAEVIDGTNPFDKADSKDADGDGISNYEEGFSYLNPTASLDTDRDGIPDYLDPDADGDSVLDRYDAFPANRLEWTDSDKDGIGNNTDIDDDNDGILDTCDVDVDGDGIPDNGTDIDTDGTTDSCDVDTDGDGVNNTADNCPNFSNANQADRDKDGQGDVCDIVELNVSQAITPNGDGINDTWFIYNIENYPDLSVRVFNSRGFQVFFSTNYKNDWTGNQEGKNEMVPVGSYLYQIDLTNDGIIDLQGWLYITK